MLRCNQSFNLRLGLKINIASLICLEHAFMFLRFWNRFQRWHIIDISLKFWRTWAVYSIIITNTNPQSLYRFVLIILILTHFEIMFEFIGALFSLCLLLRVDGFTSQLGCLGIELPLSGSQFFYRTVLPLLESRLSLRNLGRYSPHSFREIPPLR